MSKKIAIRYYGYYKSEIIFFSIIVCVVAFYKAFINSNTAEIFSENDFLSFLNFPQISNIRFKVFLQGLSILGILLFISILLYLLSSYFFHSIIFTNNEVTGPMKSPFYSKRIKILFSEIEKFGLNEKGHYFIKSNSQEIVSAGKLGEEKEKLITELLKNKLGQI